MGVELGNYIKPYIQTFNAALKAISGYITIDTVINTDIKDKHICKFVSFFESSCFNVLFNIFYIYLILNNYMIKFPKTGDRYDKFKT